VVFAAAPTTLLGYVVGGRLSDRFGRKPVLTASVLGFSLGTLLVFSGQPALYVPGFFLLAAADASVQAVRSAFAGELFPTEVRGTLGAVAGTVIVVAGSAGLLLAGLLAPWWTHPHRLAAGRARRRQRPRPAHRARDCGDRPARPRSPGGP
jgi:MFS family permease